MPKVHISKIEGYNVDFLQNRLERILSYEFSVFNKLSSHDRILLKPNLLLGIEPEYAITTHPQFVEAVGNIFSKRGFSVFVADNPMATFNVESLDKVYQLTGIKAIAERCGFKLLYPDKVSKKEGIPFSWWIDDFVIVNLPKLKTHSLTGVTLATKNLYGCVSGLHKSLLHKVYPKMKEFVKILIKIYQIIKPTINILDGIWALEGEGPSREGKRKDCNFVAVSDDALCLDYVVSDFLKFPLERNWVVRYALDNNLIPKESLEICIEPEEFSVESLRLPSVSPLERTPRFVIDLLKPWIKAYPYIDKRLCTGCAHCVIICPQKAIKIDRGKAEIDHKRCILCFCCNEVCKYGAVKLRRSILTKLFSR